MEKKKKRKALIYILLVTGLFTLLTISVFPYLKHLAEPAYQREIQHWVDKAGIWGVIILLLIQMLQIVIAFIPGEPIEVLSGALYGALGGLFLCLAGCVLASTVIFTLSRRFGKRFLFSIFGKEKMESFNWLHDHTKMEVAAFLLFFIPGTPKDMLTYVFGITGMELRRFICISSVARIPSILTSTIMGSTMRRGEWLLSAAVFVITGIIGIAGILYKDRLIAHFRKKSDCDLS